MKEAIIVKTMTPSYDAIEDRIRLSLNYQDINNRVDFMITRSFIIDFMLHIDEYIHTYYPNESNIAENPMQINVKKEDNKQKNSKSKNNKDITSQITKTKLEDLSLYKSKEELLVSLKMTYSKSSKYTTVVFIGKNNTHANLTADITILNNFINSVKKSIPNLKWGLSAYF